jgi:uncharacterized lipoprotein
MKRIFAAMAFLALVSGCALTEDSIPVTYSAPASISVVPGANLITVSVAPKDGRVANRDRVATKKNGYGMEMAKITASNDVVAEVGKAVEAELSSLGFNIGQGGIRIDVETQTFYNDFKPGFWSADAIAEVSFGLTARGADGSIMYSRSYKAVGMNNGVMLMGGENAAPALSAALRDAVQQVVADTDLHRALVKAGGALQAAAAPPIS